MRIYNNLGFMTKEVAKHLGFTHHGSCCGIPLYITEGNVMRAVKWLPLEYAMDFVEGMVHATGLPFTKFTIKDPL